MPDLNKIIELRKKLHKNPELSWKEFNTKKVILDFFEQLEPDQTIEIGETGLAFIFDSGKPGKRILFRADMDALPITEINNIDHISNNKGVSHVCGHDGHTAILCGLGKKISINKPQTGAVILLFQPAEEIGEGAEMIVTSKEYRKLNPDFVFGLHNIPGYEKNNILIKNGTFSAASKGQIVKLIGKTSHAAEPHNGLSPVMAMERIIHEYTKVIRENVFTDFTLLTIVHIKLGEEAFGTSPGEAEIMTTLRSYQNEDMDKLTSLTEEIIKKICKEESLQHKISYKEVFPANVNNEGMNFLVNKAAESNKLKVVELTEPFPWSEDFAYFSSQAPGVFFGIGAGINHPQLHNPDYDFPDDILETGIKMFYSIYKEFFD